MGYVFRNVGTSREEALEFQTFYQQMQSVGIRQEHKGEPTRKPIENKTFLHGARIGARSYRLHILVINWKPYKNVVEQSIFAIPTDCTPAAPSACTPTVHRKSWWDEQETVVKPMENDDFACSPSDFSNCTQCAFLYRLHILVIN